VCVCVRVCVCVCKSVCTYIYMYVCMHMVFLDSFMYAYDNYAVATISRLLKNLGLFCRISSLSQGSFAKETYDFKEPTNRSHPTVHAHPQNPPSRETQISWYLSRYKFRLKFWCNLNWYREIWFFRFGGFQGCSNFSGICHMVFLGSFM